MYENYCRIYFVLLHYTEIFPMEFSVHADRLHARLVRIGSDRQTTDLQRDALLMAGVDGRHLFEDKASGARDDRPGLAKALEFVRIGDCLVVRET